MSEVHIDTAAPVRLMLALAALALVPGRAAAQTCPTCVPLDDLSGPHYLGLHPPGLYPGGVNTPPGAHATLATAAIASVVPRGNSGAPDPDGWIGFLSIGMSNTNQEWALFERLADATSARNERVILVDGAIGGQSADVIVDRSDPYWIAVDARLDAAGVDPDQVQVVWLKQADGAVPVTTFPAHAETLAAHLRGIVRHVKDRFPQLQLCYISTRIYGGYAFSAARSEPLNYETAFSVRWLIEDQMNGDPDLNADAGAGPVEAPVLLWGPYLWANGTAPRASDGLTWARADLEADAVHPSPSGEAKVAALLQGFFGGDAFAAPWTMADLGGDLVRLGAVADAHVDTNNPGTNYGTATLLEWAHSNERAYVKFDLEAVTGLLQHAKFAMKVPPDPTLRPIEVVSVSNTTWDEATITAATAPAFDGGVVDTIPQASRGTTVSVDVTSQVAAALALPPGSRRVTFGLRTFPGSPAVQRVVSREDASGDGPWLVLSTEPEATPVPEPSGRAQVLAIAAGPNPARGLVHVRLVVPHRREPGEVAVFALDGSRVRTLRTGGLAAGEHVVDWDGRDAGGRLVPAGFYWLRVMSGAAHAATKIAIVR